ncbi:hypothetical protein RIF29_18763 [Crotalaria pallida]|uniref:Uncharacterized protein n=1 Tax=Crotalaria pallida TaxID=3830 RepID=A0AAN9I3I4_CROPI
MAKKRGRPPKTPSSSARKAPDVHSSHDEEHVKFDLAQLDDDDLADIESLTPKKAEVLLRNLDVLREKIKEKATITNADGDKVAMSDETSLVKDGQKSKEKDQPQEKRPTREDIEKIDEALKASDEVALESAVKDSNIDGGEISGSHTDTIVGATYLGDADSPGADSVKIVSAEASKGHGAGRFLVGASPSRPDASIAGNDAQIKDAQEQPWISVVTRSKAQARIERSKGQEAMPPSHG